MRGRGKEVKEGRLNKPINHRPSPPPRTGQRLLRRHPVQRRGPAAQHNVTARQARFHAVVTHGRLACLASRGRGLGEMSLGIALDDGPPNRKVSLLLQ